MIYIEFIIKITSCLQSLQGAKQDEGKTKSIFRMTNA